MYGRLKAQNFYKTTLASQIPAWDPSDTTEKSFQVSEAPVGKMWWLIVDFVNNKREIIFYHNVNWNTVYYYDYNRQYPSYTHEIGSIIQMNDVAEIINRLSNNIDDLWYIQKKTWLNILVRWGIVFWKNWPIEIWDTEIILDDNSTSYIVVDFNDNLIKKVDSIEVNHIPLARVVTAWWNIITINNIKSTVRWYITWDMIDKSWSKLNDIEDVDVDSVSDWKVLIYNWVWNKWQAGWNVTSEHFTDLIDTPGGYSGEWWKMLYVMPDESWIWFTKDVILQWDDWNIYQLKVNSDWLLELHSL